MDENQISGITAAVQHNCDISDGRDHGIYSMCTMVLKLRNLYKWEHGVEPWQEAEPSDLLDWIDQKEHYWETLAAASFDTINVNGHRYSPDSIEEINTLLAPANLIYGAGYGRSMKAVFFLAEKVAHYSLEGCSVIILGNEKAKEMASPFAMAQEGVVYIRRDSLRYFLWDQLQELRSTCREPLRRFFALYGMLKDDGLDQQVFKTKLDQIVENELDLFIYHEIGELLEETFGSRTMESIVRTFPGSVIELVCRTVKDLLADTHPQGLLSNILCHRRETSLCLYLGLLDGLRKTLFPEIVEAWPHFSRTGDWVVIEEAKQQCRTRIREMARAIDHIAQHIGRKTDESVQTLFAEQVISPLGLEAPHH
ncbi:MAG: hypothetical protein V2I36_00680 [Desulfopila sp.]|jgi:hypothetical protein|nr:hypothetical protein [Desulfopila sp.]